MAELLADERQADIFPVLVSIAYNNTLTLYRECQYRHQLRLAAGLQTHPSPAVPEDLFHHHTLLVHLDVYTAE